MKAQKKELKKSSKKEEGESYRPKIRIKVRSYDHRVIDEAVRTIIESVERSGAKTVGPIFLPIEKKRYTVPRSSFIHKNARDQFEIKVHKRLLDVTDFTPETVETLKSLRLPSSVNIEIKM